MSETKTAEYVTLEQFERETPLYERDFPIDGLGTVRMREITGGEAVKLHRLCVTKDPDTGQPRLDFGRYRLCRVALCMAKPSLGDTFDEKMAKISVIEGKGEVIYAQLLTAAEQVCSGTSPLNDLVGDLLQCLSDIEILLLVLDKKGGFFRDAQEKGLSELHDWAAYYLHQGIVERKQAEEAISAATGG